MKVQVEITFGGGLLLNEVINKLNLRQLKESYPNQIKNINVTVEDED